MILEQAIAVFFQLYAAAFNECDVEKITDLWSFPAYITAEERAVTYEDSAAFKENTVKLCEFYESAGLAEAKKELLTVDELYPGVVMARTNDKLHAKDGSLIAQWEHVYLLRKTGAGWKAITAVADGEVAAWRAKETPLGIK